MTDKPRMAPHPQAPKGLEQDGKGNPIPFVERTEEDKEKVRRAIADGIHTDSSSIKNPENEAEIPAPSPTSIRGTHQHQDSERDLKGQQGGQRKSK